MLCHLPLFLYQLSVESTSRNLWVWLQLRHKSTFCSIQVHPMYLWAQWALMTLSSSLRSRTFPSPKVDSYRRRLPGRKSPLTNRGTEGRTPLLCQSNEVQPSSAFYSFPDLVFWVSLSLTLPLIFSSTLKKNCNYLVLKMKAFQGSLCALPIILQLEE